MPAPIPAELKEKVKTIAVQIGVREAARAFEIPEGTVQYWSANEGWMQQKAQAEALREKKIVESGLQPASTKSPSEIMMGYKGKTKLAQAKAVYKTAKHFSKLDPETLATKTQEVKNNVDSGTKLWPDDNNQHLTQINVNLSGVAFPDSP